MKSNLPKDLTSRVVPGVKAVGGNLGKSTFFDLSHK